MSNYIDPWSPQAQERINNALPRDGYWNRDPERLKVVIDAKNDETLAKLASGEEIEEDSAEGSETLGQSTVATRGTQIALAAEGIERPL